MAKDMWFETVAFCQQAAKKRLPKSVYSALVAASERGVTKEAGLAPEFWRRGRAYSGLSPFARKRGMSPLRVGVQESKCRHAGGFAHLGLRLAAGASGNPRDVGT